jgi:peroxiredoxin
MSNSPQQESLTAQFEALHAERVRTWDPAQLAKNVDTRNALVAAFDPAKVVKVGNRVEGFDLPTSTGGTVNLKTLLTTGPVVLIFFRYAGCPACNLALPYYDRQLWPALQAEGATLVAISPHLVEKGLDDIRARHGLRFTVANDKGNALARHFGISFARGEVPPGQPTPGWTGELTGTGTAEFPQPAVIIIDHDHVVRFVDISPDWLDRTEAPEILDALRQIRTRAAA